MIQYNKLYCTILPPNMINMIYYSIIPGGRPARAGAGAPPGPPLQQRPVGARADVNVHIQCHVLLLWIPIVCNYVALLYIHIYIYSTIIISNISIAIIIIIIIIEL